MKSVSLYYTGGGSDKVYRVKLVECAGAYVVNFEFGKRGASLAAGTKTRQPVSLAEAETIFAKLVKEKTGKGYTEDTSGTPFDGDVAKLAEVLPKPGKKIVSMEQAQQWSAQEFLIQRKYDGDFTVREFTHQGSKMKVLGELVRPKSGGFFTAEDRVMFERHGSFFAAFTVSEFDGENLLVKSAAARQGHLLEWALSWDIPQDCIIADRVTDVRAAICAGGEGVVAHRWSDSWGEMFCVKQLGTWRCKVTATGMTQSVEIADAETGEPRGNVKLGGGKCDRVRVGSVIKVEGMGLSDSGKIREPRVCADSVDSWLVSH